MRIIAGTKKGLKLLCPKTQDTRPITDRIKESLFNVLRSRDLIAGRRVADVFSGVGSLGLEALSRGAQFATFVEQDPKIAVCIDKNIAKAGFADQSRVVRINAFRFGAPVEGLGLKHDLVFVDPPYVRTHEAGVGSLLDQLLVVLGSQVTEQGVAVVRTKRGVSLLDSYGTFDLMDRRDWGTMTLALYQVRGHGE